MKIVTFFLMLFTLSSFSQDLKKHQWKNRVLLIYTDDKNADDFKHQIKVLSEDKKGLAERKLVVYQFTKNDFTVNFDKVWLTSNYFIKNYVHNNETFKVLLIGLDGGIKLEQNKILSLEKLFAIIDGMPMRKRELKRKN